jgi:hypothetical protein
MEHRRFGRFGDHPEQSYMPPLQMLMPLEQLDVCALERIVRLQQGEILGAQLVPIGHRYESIFVPVRNYMLTIFLFANNETVKLLTEQLLST